MEDIRFIPISLIVAKDDTTCPPEQAAILASKLSTLENNVSVEGDHKYPFKNQSAEYFKVLTDELVTNGSAGNDGATRLASATALLTLFTTATLFLQ